jgi:hypothetical protein
MRIASVKAASNATLAFSPLEIWTPLFSPAPSKWPRKIGGPSPSGPIWNALTSKITSASASPLQKPVLKSLKYLRRSTLTTNPVCPTVNPRRASSSATFARTNAATSVADTMGAISIP